MILKIKYFQKNYLLSKVFVKSFSTQIRESKYVSAYKFFFGKTVYKENMDSN
jgi:hypothetical protein